MHALLLALSLTTMQGDSVPLYDNLGSHHVPITTGMPVAQAYFDQGMRLYYAFNHAEAVRSFRVAQRLDDDCAMCWWGEALAWGPNINLPMDSAAGVAAYAAIREALARQEGESERERALISALATRYVPVPPADRAGLDSAYARAMADVARRWPADEEAAVLYAESLMDLRPWDYWTEGGELVEGMRPALASLERVVASSPQHPGACHFFIHAVEAVQPDRAVPCAERLANLMPGAGHLVHMPGHIYIRVGRYADAIRANEHAVHADETWIQDQNPGPGMYTVGYYPHNYDFMAFGAAMAGRSDMAIEAAEKVAALIPAEMLADPNLGFAQHWTMRHLQMRVRFARWEEILGHPAPDAGLLHARGLWHYARGRAFVGLSDLKAARAELDKVSAIAADPALEGFRAEFNASTTLLAIAEAVLAGRIAAAENNWDAAIARLREAVRLEDSLYYGEPPEWTVPTRQELGEVLLAAGRPDQAATAFSGDLEVFRENGWSLHGLARALRAQGRNDEAAAVEARFRQAWREADVELPL